MATDKIRSRDATPEYRAGWEAIWGKGTKGKEAGRGPGKEEKPERRRF